MPYTIVDITVVPYRTSVDIEVELSENSLFQCGVYVSGAASPASLYTIISQGHATSTVSNSTVLSINGLVASTDYKLFCLTKTQNSVLTTSYLRMMENEMEFSTTCCRHITVDLQIKDVSSELDTLNVLKIKWDALPQADIYVNLTARYRFNSSLPFTGYVVPFQPSSLKLKSSIRATSFTSAVAAKRTPGEYFLDFNMTGWNDIEIAKYEILYTQPSPKLTVIDKYEPPTPNVTASYFSDDGVIVYIYFDSPTNLGGQGFGMFDCDVVVVFPAASTSQCIWESRTLLHIYSDIDLPLNVGDSVSIVSNVVKAHCTNTAEECEKWAYVSATETYTIETAIDAVVPAPNIDAAASIGSCDVFILDLSLAAGSGGRDWTTLIITVTSPNDYNVTKLNNFYKSQYNQSPPTPAHINLFELNGIYEFDVYVCNFLGKCSLSGNYKHTVEYEPVTRPIAYILGESQHLITENRLKVKCVAYVEKCSGDLYNDEFYIANRKSTADLSYTWEIFKDGVEDSSLSEYTGISSVPELTIPPYSFFVGSVYLIRLTVTYGFTGLSTTDTLDVFIEQADITAIIGGGKEITLPMGTSALLDGSLSIDGNIDPAIATGVAAGLSFEWSCFLSSPLDTDDCGVMMQLQGTDDLLKISPVDNHNVDYVNSTSTITLTAFDDSGRLPSSTSVSVRIISGGAPIITLSAEATRILPTRKLKLFSTVEANSSTQLMWSVDSPSVSLDLNELSLTAISRQVLKGIHTFNLVLKESSLPARGTLSFVLQAGTSTASIDVAIIGPPVPGRITISPDEGLEMSTTFDIGTSLWTDLELPITYAFGYVTNEGTMLSIQSRSEDTYALMTSPSGRKENNFLKTFFVKAFNPLDANDVLKKVVMVNRQEVNADELTSIITEQLNEAENETDSNVVKQIVNVASSTMNNVNCSLAPNCSLINRGPCFKLAHTCGECITSHIGEDGHDNTMCYETAANYNVTLNMTTVTTCLADSDCALFQLCNSSSETCYFPPKTCKFDCNGLGNCVYKNKKTGASVLNCVQGDTSCVARCDCGEGFGGETCELSQAELNAKLKAREEMAVALSSVVASEQLDTPDAVQDLIGMIEALSGNPFELTVQACDSLSSMVTLAISGVESLDMAYEDLSALYATLDDCQTVYIENGEVISLDRRRRMRSLSGTAAGINNLISDYVEVISNGIEGGQDLVSGPKKNFRTTNFFSSNENFLEFSVAQTTAEIAANAPTSTVTIDLNVDSVGTEIATGLIESVYQMYNEIQGSTLIGNPLRVEFSRSTVAAQATVTFFIVNVVDGIVYGGQLDTNETFVTSCDRGVYKIENYTCESGYVLEHVCHDNSTTSSTLSTVCPTSTYLPLCGLIIDDKIYKQNPDPHGNSSCTVIDYSNSNVTCECNVFISASDGGGGSDRRRLDSSSSGGIEVVSMASFIADGFVNTIRESDEWTLEDLGQVWIIITMVSTLWAFGVFIVFALSTKRYHEYKMKETQVGAVNDNWELADNSQKKKYILNYLEDIFPSVFIDPAWTWAGLRRELSAYHRHYTVFTLTGKGSNRTRFVKVLQLLSLHTLVFWILAVTFDAYFPSDDGECALKETQDGCLSEKSALDANRHKCKWVVSDDVCEYEEVTLSLKALVILVLVMSVLYAIFNIPVEFLFRDIINAPLASDYDEKVELDMLISEEAASNGSESGKGHKIRLTSKGGIEMDRQRALAAARPKTFTMKLKSWFGRHFRWEDTRLLSEIHVEVHDKVLEYSAGTNFKACANARISAGQSMNMVFDYPELLTFVAMQREYLLDNDPNSVPEFDEKWR